MFAFRSVLAVAFLSIATGCAVEQASESVDDEATESAKADEDKKPEGIKIETDGVTPAKKGDGDGLAADPVCKKNARNCGF